MVFWVLFVVAFGFFLQRVRFLTRLVLLGRKEDRFDNLAYRLARMLALTISQWCSLKNLRRDDLAPIGHAFIFWAFGLFLISYVVFIGGAGLGLSSRLAGSAFEGIYNSVLDVAAVLVSAAVVWAVIRRYILRPKRLEGKATVEAGVILSVVFGLMILHALVEGFANAAWDTPATLPPLGSALARFLGGAGISQTTLVGLYRGLWWLHYVVILGFLVAIPRSKHLHMFTSFINILFQSSTPKGALRPVDLSSPANFGVAKLDDFTWKQLLDLLACTVCGRCHSLCPAQLSGKLLSPRDVVQTLKEHLLGNGQALLSARLRECPASATSERIQGTVVTEDEIWACTTCRVCQQVCSSGIEHVDTIMDLKRNLVMTAASDTAKETLKSLRVRGHPWRGTALSRGDWAEGLDIQNLAETGHVDVLYWVGCTAALEERATKVARAMAKLMKLAGIRFAILSEEEACCGDAARRLGNDYLFQTRAQENIDMLKGYEVRKVVTTCPHCFNTIKNEYPQLGGDFEVVHHSEFLATLLSEEKLQIRAGGARVVTYHDPCYLGRYNDIYDAPRRVLEKIPGLTLAGMEKDREHSFCCGAGGGRVWLEEKTGTRISEMRIDQAIRVRPDILATACPLCLYMLEDAAKAKYAGDSLAVKDIAELLEESIVPDSEKRRSACYT